LILSCHEKEKADEHYDIDDLKKERIEDVEMIYSDSAIVQFRIKSPLLLKYEEDNVAIEEFPHGFSIEFFDRSKNVISKLQSKYAERRSVEGLLLLRDSVVYVNQKNDRLETNYLTIDELKNEISTKKFFRLIKYDTRDTLYGRGFTANSDFSKLEISKYVGKRAAIDLSNE
jgi:LPS export ABC transporter protein LptC